MKKAIVLIFSLFLCVAGFSQTDQLTPVVKSPNVSNFETFGNYPVSLFTGTPNISLPIYTLSSGNISVPINLSYHPSNVKPSVQPGWVGFGWSLNPGGVITRNPKGLRDEFLSTEYLNAYKYVNPTYYPYSYSYPNPDIDPDNIVFGSEVINDNVNWNSQENLKKYMNYGVANPNPDILADIFHFNFMGYSGKFIYSGPSKGWQVVSDQHLKVEITGFFNPDEVIDDVFIPGYGTLNHPSTNLFAIREKQSRFFKGFIITTPDGTQYEFGGVNGVELTSPYAVEYGKFSIDTWKLIKITDINNNIVDFEYKKTYPTCNLSFSGSDVTFHVQGADSPGGLWTLHGNSGSVSSSTTIDVKELYGNYNWVSYLSKISSSNMEVLFDSDVADCLVYTRGFNGQLNKPVTGNLNDDVFNYINDTVLGTRTHNLQWEQLNTIEVKKIGATPLENSIIHEFTYFEDGDDSVDSSQRLGLKAYEKRSSSDTDTSQKHFEFRYNDLGFYSGITCDGNSTDHWGFLNNKKIPQFSSLNISNIPSIKASDPYYALKGLLQTITYPTGGTTEFTWQANDYSQVVSTNRYELDDVANNSNTGGVRIKKIQSKSIDNVVQAEKEYFYKKGYSNQEGNPSSLISSGVLNVIPQYVMHFSERENTLGEGGTASYTRSSYNSNTNYSYTGQGSHIGYDEVVEKNLDGSYTKYFYSSYDTDVHGDTHFDHSTNHFLGFKPEVDRYMPHFSLENERGKQLRVQKFNNLDVIVEQNDTYYRGMNMVGSVAHPDNYDNPNNYIRRIPMEFHYTLLFSNPAEGIGLIAATHEYTYSYFPIKTETTSYDLAGNNPIVSSVEYDYNDTNQVVEQKTTNSSEVELKTTYTYPSNYTAPVYEGMVAANYITPVITKTAMRGGTQVSDYIKNYYEPFAGIYALSDVKVSKESGIGNGVIQNFNEYDGKGNVLEASRENGITSSYFWGYNGEYPIAKIENASYTTIATALGISLAALKQFDEDDLSQLSGLRDSEPSFMITTYVYDPFVGVLSVTDSRKNVMTYEYDGFNRLKAVRDSNGDLVTDYEYNYKKPE